MFHAIAKSLAILLPVRRSLTTAFASLSASNPQAGQECSQAVEADAPRLDLGEEADTWESTHTAKTT